VWGITPGRGVPFPVSQRLSQIPLVGGLWDVLPVTATLGYARVSTIGQDLDAQLAALSAVRVDRERVFTDKLSGSARTARPGLAAMLDYARPGDVVVVAAIDRLGRSVAEVTRTIADLGERRIILRALREGIDTATPTGRAVAAIMATLAELELELGRERRAASRESRRARSLPATKPPKLSPERQEQLRRLAATGEPVHQLAEAFGIGRATAYRYLSSPQHESARPRPAAVKLNRRTTIQQC
jgi:DNA invertase Pin-like site-specific DNA recombinase